MVDVLANPVPAAAARRGLVVPSVLRCGLMLFALKVLLKARSLGWTLQWLKRQVLTVPEAVSVDADDLQASEYAVAMAGAFYPGRALCLEQSLVLYYLLRRQGAPVKYCQGVQPYPFLSHAWVEYRGEPINDVAEHVKEFARLPDQLP